MYCAKKIIKAEILEYIMDKKCAKRIMRYICTAIFKVKYLRFQLLENELLFII